jgi:PAS domain-containing protein
LEWDVGVFWLVDPQGRALRCLETWRRPAARVERFEAACREQAFASESGLPGRVWSAARPLWISDVSGEKNFPRLTTAAEAGLRGAFAVPLPLGAQVLGIVEFLSRSPREPDADLLEMMATVGGQIGQFMRRKQTEDALRQSEQRFRGLMEQAPFSIQLFSPDGWTLEVNRAWEELWNTPAARAKEYNILADPQLEAKGVLSSIRRAFAGEAIALPAIEYDPNEAVPDPSRPPDPRRWVSAVAYPLKDPSGRVREVALVHTDITARKRAEDALRDSEERFRGIVSHSVAGVAEADLTGRFLFANERYCEIVGRSLEELLQLGMQDISHPDDLQINLPLLERLGREGTPYIIEKR